MPPPTSPKMLATAPALLANPCTAPCILGLEINCLRGAARWMESFGQIATEDWEMLERALEQTDANPIS